MVVFAMSISLACFLGRFRANGLLYDQDHACLGHLLLQASYRSCFLVTSGRVQILRPVSVTAATDGRQSTSSGQASHEAPPSSFRLQPNRIKAKSPLGAHIHTYDGQPPLRLRARRPRSSLPISTTTKARPLAFLCALPGPSRHYHGGAESVTGAVLVFRASKSWGIGAVQNTDRASQSKRSRTIAFQHARPYLIYHTMPRTQS